VRQEVRQRRRLSLRETKLRLQVDFTFRLPI
jgi:hypothetical protein